MKPYIFLSLCAVNNCRPTVVITKDHRVIGGILGYGPNAADNYCKEWWIFDGHNYVEVKRKNVKEIY